MQEFKQQTIQLLKQQITQLKLTQKQLLIKDQQIGFLKQTILNLQQEKDQLSLQLFNNKQKLKMMFQQVSTYNSTVVSRVHQDNTQMAQELQEIRNQLNNNIQIIQRLTKNSQFLEDKNSQFKQQLESMKQKSLQQQMIIQKLNTKISNYENSNKQLKQKQIKLNIKNQQLSNQIKNLSNQIDTLTKKSQETINITENKIKHAIDTMVSKEKYNDLQKRLIQYDKQFTKMSLDLNNLQHQKEKLIYAKNQERQMSLNSQTRFQFIRGQIDKDLTNLKQSFKIGKKVAEFQCVHQETLNHIYQSFSKMLFENKEFRVTHQIYDQQLDSLKNTILINQSEIQELKTENQLCKISYKQELQSVQSQYQGKILQLSLKLKKQQRALKKLNIKQRQLQDLSQRLKYLEKEHLSLKQSSQRTIEMMKKQNNKLILEIQEMAELCQNNIQAKNSLNKVKYVLMDMNSVIHYLHMINLGYKQRIRKLFMPFISYYFRKSQKQKQRQKKNNKKRYLLSKFRIAAYVVFLIESMKKDASQNRKLGYGVSRLANKAIKQRYKVGNNTMAIQRMMNYALKQKQKQKEKDISSYTSLQKNEKQKQSLIGNIVQSGKNCYKWDYFNYPRINLYSSPSIGKTTIMKSSFESVHQYQSINE